MGKRNMKKASKKAIFFRTLGAVFLAAGVVFTMMIVGRMRSLDEFKANLAKISETRTAIEAWIDGKVESAELGDEELKAWDEFETAYRTASDGYAIVEPSEFARKERDTLKEQWGRIEKLYRVEQIIRLMTDGELDDEDLAKMSEADNEKLKTYAADLIDYRAKVADFKEKYETVDTSKNVEMKTAYDGLIKLGDELQAKYGEMSLADILEMSRDDILAFYETIDLLKNKE